MDIRIYHPTFRISKLQASSTTLPLQWLRSSRNETFRIVSVVQVVESGSAADDESALVQTNHVTQPLSIIHRLPSASSLFGMYMLYTAARARRACSHDVITDHTLGDF